MLIPWRVTLWVIFFLPSSYRFLSLFRIFCYIPNGLIWGGGGVLEFGRLDFLLGFVIRVLRVCVCWLVRKMPLLLLTSCSRSSFVLPSMRQIHFKISLHHQEPQMWLHNLRVLHSCPIQLPSRSPLRPQYHHHHHHQSTISHHSTTTHHTRHAVLC